MKIMKHLIVLLVLLVSTAEAKIPEAGGVIYVETQPWPLKPGRRYVDAEVFFPLGNIKAVNRSTGIMLVLHNWGGVDAQGTADPQTMANRNNVIAITVNYLQSGDEAFGPLPYDHGLYQAIDVLRVLQVVVNDLKARRVKFDSRRIYGVGGSGGGNVLLMANRLAPRTFAAILAMSAPLRMEQEEPLDARWQIVPLNEYLIRDLTINLPGWRIPSSYVQLVHGDFDQIAPYENALAAQGAINASLFSVVSGIFWGPFQDAGHTVGDRTQIAIYFEWMFQIRRPSAKSDLDYRDTKIKFSVPGGVWTMDYKRTPTLRWGSR